MPVRSLARRIGVAWTSYIVFVLIPTLVAGLYFGFIASKEYVSEARFTVRAAPDTRQTPDLSSMLSLVQLFGAKRNGEEDAYVVTNYIKSPSVIRDLGGKQIIFDAYSRSAIDWWSRLASDASIEKVVRYWNGHVQAVLDIRSGIITLDVSAYSANEAEALATKIVSLSEKLVNDISDRARADALGRAEKDVEESEERLRLARETLLEFRNGHGLLDPESSAASIAKVIGELTVEKAKLENDLAMGSGSMTAQAPTQRLLKSRLDNIDKQIANLKSNLTNKKNAPTLANDIASYEDLQLKVKFAERLYEISKAAYDRARQELQKQQLYLEVVVDPRVPERAIYPRRIANTILVLVWGSIIWSILALTLAGVRDHAH
jgi:BexC/CtrB/KpsE family polysaccharide export inner-membrane protein